MKHTCETSGCAEKTKTCTKCGEVKPFPDFHRNSTRKDGHREDCKTCVREYTAAYNAANKERRRKRDKAYYEANRAEKIQWQREYHAANRKERNAASREYYAANRERAIAYRKAWYEQNRDYALAYRRTYYANTFEEREKARKAYYAKNREVIRAKRKAYRAEKWVTDPHFRAKYYASNLRRKRLLKGADQEPYSREEIFERDNWTCRLCGYPIDPSTRFPDSGTASIDHVVPLSKGGGDTPSNVQAAHLGCNVGKGNRTDLEQSA